MPYLSLLMYIHCVYVIYLPPMLSQTVSLGFALSSLMFSSLFIVEQGLILFATMGNALRQTVFWSNLLVHKCWTYTEERCVFVWCVVSVVGAAWRSYRWFAFLCQMGAVCIIYCLILDPDLERHLLTFNRLLSRILPYFIDYWWITCY